MKLKNYSDNKIIEFKTDILNTYVCGPTVYDSVHVGNIRSILIMDLLASAFKATGKRMKLIHNITDIDDKIITRAKEKGVTELELTEKYTEEYFELLEKLNIKNIYSTPKVTENVGRMIDWVQEIINKDMAYEVNGSVYFKVTELPSYGKDHKLNQEEFLQGKNDHTNKKHSSDFALWKNTERGIQYDSPWGKGRPGWHTECALFIAKEFNRETIDIHGGGIDLRFPHHVNEDAQFKAVTGKKLSNVYSYVGHLSMNGVKMSKSLGNIVYAKDFINKYSANILRYALISTHYTKPMDFNEDFINNATKEIMRFKNTIQKGIMKVLELGYINDELSHEYNEVIESILNDIDTSKAITIINKIMKSINKSNNNLSQNLNTLIKSLKVLGFKFTVNYNDEISTEYRQAKKSKDWKKIDTIRERVLRF